MFKLYLSASNQPHNMGIDGVTEQNRMHRMIDRILYYLDLSIMVVKHNPENFTVGQIVRDSNDWGADLHVACHTNAMGKPGSATGVEGWIHNDSKTGNEIADLIVHNVAVVLGVRIRPGKEDPDSKETGVDGGRLAEVDRTNCPACLIEICFHDNLSDVEKLEENFDRVAKAIGDSINIYVKRRLSI